MRWLSIRCITLTASGALCLLPPSPCGASADDTAAESAAVSKSPPPCSGPEFRQFDFWLGTWDLAWSDGGRGSNSISAILDSCVVQEEFDGRPAMYFTGKSVSTFDRRQALWKQTWVDNQGGYLDFVGGWQGDRMVLTRVAVVDSAGVIQRMVWYDIEPDRLEWNWERSKDDGKTWEVLWQIHYLRRQ